MKLENKTVEELKNMCRNKKISGYSKLNKQGLVNLLNNKKVKKGGDRDNSKKSFMNIEVGSYYLHKNEYVGKLIEKKITEGTNKEPTSGILKFNKYENLPNYGKTFINIDKLEINNIIFTQLTHQGVTNQGFKVWSENLPKNKGGSKSNKKGGYVPYHWLTPLNFNYRSNNGITKNNLAGNYFYAFVPFQVYSSLDLMNFKINNESNYPKINMMIFDYLFGYGLSENKEKVYKIIKDYIPAKTLNKEGKNNQGKKAICTWWCLDSNLNFQQRKGTYIDSNIYSNFKPQLKKGLPLKFTDYDGFIIIETSDWI